MPAKMSLWAVLAAMVDRPGAALANIAAYPRWRWLPPIVLIVAALAASLALSAPLLTVQTRQVMAEQMARLPAEQAQLLAAQVERLETPQVVVASALATALTGLALGWLAQAAALYFGALIAGGELEFKRVLAVIPWLSLPFALEAILQAAFAVTQGHLVVNQGLAYLVSVGKPLEDMRNLAYVALGQLTLFRLWHWVLVYALLRRAVKLSGGTAVGLTLVYAALGLGLQLALAALAALLNPQ